MNVEDRAPGVSVPDEHQDQKGIEGYCWSVHSQLAGMEHDWLACGIWPSIALH